VGWGVRRKRSPSVAAVRRSRRRASALQRRIVARVHRLRQIRLLVVGPELADVAVDFDGGIDQLAVLALDLADEDVADNVAEMIEMEGAARRVGERNGAQRAPTFAVRCVGWESMRSAWRFAGTATRRPIRHTNVVFDQHGVIRRFDIAIAHELERSAEPIEVSETI